MSDHITYQVFINGEMVIIDIHESDYDSPLFTLKDIIYQHSGEYVYSFHITPDEPELDEQLTLRALKLSPGSRLFCKTFAEHNDLFKD